MVCKQGVIGGFGERVKVNSCPNSAQKKCGKLTICLFIIWFQGVGVTGVATPGIFAHSVFAKTETPRFCQIPETALGRFSHSLSPYTTSWDRIC